MILMSSSRRTFFLKRIFKIAKKLKNLPQTGVLLLKEHPQVYLHFWNFASTATNPIMNNKTRHNNTLIFSSVIIEDQSNCFVFYKPPIKLIDVRPIKKKQKIYFLKVASISHNLK